MKKIISFTTILHDKRKELELNLMEYCVADTIYNLSSNPKSPVQGWCYASKDTLAEILDTTRQTVFTIVNKLIGKGLVERHSETKYLRTTEKWFNFIIVEGDLEQEVIEEPKETKPEKTKVLKYDEKDKELSDLLFTLVRQNYDFIKPKTQPQLLKDYEEMHRLSSLDGWSYDQIKSIIIFSQHHSFWKQNIRSVKTLRKQFERLVIEQKGAKKNLQNEVMYAPEDGTAFIKMYGRWVVRDNPNSLIDMNYYKSLKDDRLLTKEEYDKHRKTVMQGSR